MIKKATRSTKQDHFSIPTNEVAIIAAAVKAVIVKNHPPTTLITPATLYTALSLPQALSAKEYPLPP